MTREVGEPVVSEVRSQVSVVIPTRDRVDRLRRTLECVRAQEDVDVEIIVVIDGSDDGTAEYLARLSNTRISVVCNESPLGVASARNAGFARCSKEWIAFCDDDDLWAPGKLRSQIIALREHPDALWCASGAVLVDDNLTIIGGQPPPEESDISRILLQRNCIPGGGSGIVVSRSLLRDCGGFDAKFSNLADWDLWIRLARRSSIARCRVRSLPTSCTAAVWRTTPSAATESYDCWKRSTAQTASPWV